MELALDDLQMLISHKTQATNQQHDVQLIKNKIIPLNLL